MSRTPEENYKDAIKYLSEDPNFKGIASTLIPQLKREQKKAKNWRYRGTSWAQEI